MRNRMPSAILAVASSLAVLSIFSVAAYKVRSQEKPKPEVIQAHAMGQLRASGKQFSVAINIQSYSNPQDQQTLIDAFTKGGHNALVKTLSKMQSGRVAITGTLGYQIAYIRTFPTENGRTIRLITDRPVNFPEAYASTRTKDYDLSGIELNLAPDPKQNTGSLVVAGRFKMDKAQQVTF